MLCLELPKADQAFLETPTQGTVWANWNAGFMSYYSQLMAQFMMQQCDEVKKKNSMKPKTTSKVKQNNTKTTYEMNVCTCTCICDSETQVEVD